MATRTLSALALTAALVGCCGSAPKPLEVKIPIAVRAQPPAELVDCGRGLPLPAFEACGPAGWSCLPPVEEARLRELLHGLARCGEAWRVWATAP